MKSGIRAGADWRALLSAGFIGSGVGLALGALYLGAGLGRAVLDHSQAGQIADTAAALRAGPDSAGLALALAAPAAAVADAVQPASAPLAAPPVAEQVAAPKATRASELECLTQAVYFEARGESARGQQAVATVIMNRVKNPNFPKTVCGVVYQGASHRNGCQFSFACDGIPEHVDDPKAWKQAMDIAKDVIGGKDYLPEVGYATHYHATYVYPHWAPRMKKVTKIGMHVFYQFKRGWKFG